MKITLLLSSIASFAASSAVDNAAMASASADQNEERNLQWNPNCGTVALWHPVYTAGWENGYCSETITCNSPSYTTAADCCGSAYLGQSSGTCYSAAGIPAPAPPTPPPVPGVTPVSPATTMWYPDYNAGWEAGKCIDTLPLPPYGSRPLYTTQLECCKLAYAGQSNNYCIANMANPPTAMPTTFKPTASPSVSPTSKPTNEPTTSSPSKAPTTVSPTMTPTSSPSKTPTTVSPTMTPTATPTSSPTLAPTAKPSSSPSLAPTKSPTATPTATPTKSPTASPTTKSPTGSPTTASPTVTQYGSQWYPKYDNAGTCTAKLPLPPPGSRSFFASKEACCQGTYSTWGPPKAQNCIDGSTQ